MDQASASGSTAKQPQLKYCDIETMSLGNAINLFEHHPPKNFKDEEKIEAHRKEALAKFLERAALSPLTGRVLAIGYLTPREGKEPKVYLDLARLPAYEERVITDFLKHLCQKDVWSATISGYCFHDFDLPFILTRARILGLPILDRIPSDMRMLKAKVQDVYREITCWCGSWNKDSLFPNAKLSTLADVFGVVSSFRDTECSGADFHKCLMSDDETLQTQAIDHLTADLWETYNLAQACKLPG